MSRLTCSQARSVVAGLIVCGTFGPLGALLAEGTGGADAGTPDASTSGLEKGQADTGVPSEDAGTPVHAGQADTGVRSEAARMPVHAGQAKLGERADAGSADGDASDGGAVGVDVRAETASTLDAEADALPTQAASEQVSSQGRGSTSPAPAEETTVPSVSARDERSPSSSRPRLAIFGLGADVGLPDGANLSLVVRPLGWARFQLALGSNSIGYGIRVGASLVPMREGPGLVAEYGHYWDGNANGLVARLAGDGYQSSPVMDRVGYDYFNLHLSVNFGYQRMVFFVQGGLSMVRGHLNRSDPTAYGPSNIQVAFVHRPRFTSTGIAGKLGLLIFVW